MKTTHRILFATTTALVLCFGQLNARAQAGGGGWGGNMDPQQVQQMIQQRLMDSYRQQLVVTNDAEWKVVEERLTKVVRLRAEISRNSSSMGMLNGMGRMGGMGRTGGLGRNAGGTGGGLGALLGAGEPDRNAVSLQTAVDSNAPAAQIREGMNRLREGRKQKQAELAKAQEELRSLLTTRQEAILVLGGMLD